MIISMPDVEGPQYSSSWSWSSSRLLMGPTIDDDDEQVNLPGILTRR